ncbi:MAG: hypothetical protein ACR2OM_08135 [Aestuariivirgaceae bacterium]
MVQLLKTAGKACLTLLVLCIVFQIMFVAMAYTASLATEPPACQVGFSFPLPFASCPGFGFDASLDYMLALPGAVLALPFILPSLISETSSPIQPFVLIPLVIHIFAWGYLIFLFIRWWRSRAASTS